MANPDEQKKAKGQNDQFGACSPITSASLRQAAARLKR